MTYAIKPGTARRLGLNIPPRQEPPQSIQALVASWGRAAEEADAGIRALAESLRRQSGPKSEGA